MRRGKTKIVLYERRFRRVSEQESDHVHLDDGTVIRNSELLRGPAGIAISTYSEKKQVAKIAAGFEEINRIIARLRAEAEEAEEAEEYESECGRPWTGWVRELANIAKIAAVTAAASALVSVAAYCAMTLVVAHAR